MMQLMQDGGLGMSRARKFVSVKAIQLRLNRYEEEKFQLPQGDILDFHALFSKIQI